MNILNQTASAKPRTSESIAEVLIADIRAGEIADGATLPTERALSERFDSSRPTIRALL